MSGTSVDLTGSILTGSTFCLNEKRAHPHTNLFIGDGTLKLESDADPQLLLYIPFKETVKLSHIALTAAPDAPAPTVVKVYVNKVSFGFSDVDTVPAQTIRLRPADLAAGAKIPLLAVKFTAVRSLHLFFDADDDGESDCSALSGLRVYGEPVAGTNMAELKKC